MKKNVIRKDLVNDIVFYNSAEVIEILQISRATFQNYLKSGKLHGTKIGGSWRFTKDDIYNFTNSLKSGSDVNQEKEE